MDKLNLVPPYLKERMELIKLFGIKKFLLSLVVVILECTVIFFILYGLIFLATKYPTLGLTLIAIVVILLLASNCLICWGKRRKERMEYDNKEKDL